MRLFIYEMISACGLGTDAAASLRREGWAMLSAIVEDFSNVPGVEVVTMLDRSCAASPRCECHIVHSSTETGIFRELAACADSALIIAPEFDDHLAARSQ